MAKNNKVKYSKEHAEYFDGVYYCLEATHNEQFMFWKIYWHDKVNEGVTSWEEVGMGKCATIGYIDDRPICVTIFYAIINKAKVAFYEGTSQLVDHKMIEDWLDLHFKKNTDGRGNISNASNFHHCLLSIRDHFIDIV